ncbi:MAG: hypothetical protein V5786_01215 [Psychromonas sp.]
MSKPRAKKEVKKTTPFQKILRSSENNSRLIFTRTLNELTAVDVRRYSKNILSNVNFKGFDLTNRTSFSLFYQSRHIKNTEDTLSWVEAIILHSYKKINEFIELENKITKVVLCGNYTHAIELIDEVESLLGKSFWAIQLKSYLLYKMQSAEESKKFLSTEVGKVNTGLTNFILNQIGSRVDQDDIYFTSTKDFNRKLEEAFSSDLDFLYFLKYKTLPSEYTLGSISSTSILSYEIYSSIIDLYKAYLFCLTNEISHNDLDKALWLDSSKRIIKSVSDPSLKSLSFALGDIDLTSELCRKEQIEFIDYYTKGDYEQVVGSYQKSIHLQSSFNAFEIFTKSLIRTGPVKVDGVIEEYVIELKSILLKDSSFINCHSNSFNNSFSLSSLNWFFNYHLFLSMNALNIKSSINQKLKKAYFAKSDLFTAFKCEVLTKDDKRKVLSVFDTLCPSSESLELFKLYSDSSNDNSSLLKALSISEERKYKYLALHYSGLKEFNLSYQYYKKLHESKDEISKVEAVSGLIITAAEAGHFEQAAKLLCESYINKNLTHHNLPIEIMCEKLHERTGHYSSIYIPICFAIYTEIYGDLYLVDLSVSFEFFLIKNDALDFTSLLEKTNSPNKELVTFFLEKVYTPNIMKDTLLFKGRVDRENKRIPICQYLIENNLGDKDKLLEEVKSISKSLVLTNATSHIENTKIHLDIEYVKRHVENECKPLFDKYTRLLGNDYSKSEDEIELIIFRDRTKHGFETQENLANAHIYQILQSIHLTNCPPNEKNKVFMDLIKKIRDEFTGGVKGLGGNISTRITHGIIDTHYRKALLDDALLKKSSNSEFNYFWTEKLSPLEREVTQKIDEVIGGFSSSFKDLIDKVINDWLQITQIDLDFSTIRTSKEKGVFNYSISNTLAYELQIALAVSTDYEYFWKVIKDWLLITTDSNLLEAQDLLENTLIPEFKTLFDDLQNNLIQIKRLDLSDITELINAVASSRQKLINRVKESSKWLCRNEVDLIESVEIDIVIEIVKRSLSCDSENTIHGDIEVLGAQLSYFVDIMYLLFANAIKHSKLDKDLLSIQTEVKLTDGSIEIIVTNKCRACKIYKSKNEKLIKYQDIYSTEKSLTRLKTKGHTGFYKIQKVIKEDLLKNYTCEIKYLNQNTFQVRTLIKP